MESEGEPRDFTGSVSAITDQNFLNNWIFIGKSAHSCRITHMQFLSYKVLFTEQKSRGTISKLKGKP